MSKQIQHINSEEISLKDLILKVNEIWKYLLKNRLSILVTSLLGACIGVGIAWMTEPLYTAKLTFSVENEKANPLGTYAGLASMAGIDLGGSGGSLFSTDNIVSIMTSRKMLVNTLLSPVSVNNHQSTLIEFWLQFNRINEQWSHKPELKKLKFPLNLNPSLLSRDQDSILTKVFVVFNQKVISISKPDKKLNLIEATCTSKNELFSKVFLETLANQVTDFYVSIKTKRQKENVDILQKKADSLYRVISSSMYKGASLGDQNLNMARQVAGVDRQRKQIDVQVASTAYTEIIKNLEMAKVTLQKETPLIQVIDQPVFPLKKEKPSRLMGLMVGGLLGGFLTIGFLLGKQYFSKLMSEEER